MTTVVVPFARPSTDAHLPIGTDALLADAVGREVARRLDAMLAPTVRVGCAVQHMNRRGTISLRSATLSDLAVDAGRSLVRRGFHTIVLCSTHGGNRQPMDTAASRLNESLGGVFVCAPTGNVGSRPGAHSGEWIISVMLALHPHLVEIDQGNAELQAELPTASVERGCEHLECFIGSIVTAARGAATAR